MSATTEATVELTAGSLGAAPQTAAETSRATALGMVYSVLCYFSFLASFGYFVFYLNDLFVPVGVNSGEPTGLFASLAINTALILGWAIQHSWMARDSFKRAWTRVVPKHAERATYVLSSSIALTLVMALWAPTSGQVWLIESSIAQWALWGTQIVGWTALLIASFEIDHFELFGLKQPFYAMRGKPMPEKDFQQRFIYRVVRHPIQTGILCGLWLTPSMTVTQLTLAVLMTLYIFVGLYFEERALIRRFGARYEEYRRRVPQLIPFTKW